MAESKVKILEEFKDKLGNRYQKYQESSGKIKYRTANSKNAYKFSSLEKFEAAREKIKKESKAKYEQEVKQYKKDLEEYNKKEAASLEIIRKKKADNDKIKAQLKKTIKNPELDKLNSFLNEIIMVSDSLGAKSVELYDLYVKYINTSNLTGVGRKYLTLSKNYEALDRKFGSLYQSVKKNKLITKQVEDEFEKLVAGIDPLEQTEKNLLVEEDAIQKKSNVKDQSRQNKIQERLTKLTQKQGLRDKVREEKENKKKAIIEEKNDQEQKLQALADEKKKRLAKQEKINKFFSSENSLVKVGSKTGGILGSAIGGPLAAFGFDFSDEKQFLSQLFSPVSGLARYGIGKVKSITEKSIGVDEQTIDSLDDIFTNKGTGLKKKVDLNKVSQRLNQVGKDPKRNIFNGFKTVKDNLKKIGGTISGNISNILNRNNSSSRNNSVQNTYSNIQNSNVNQSQSDYNRTDDQAGFINLKPTNELLEDILKELKKQGGDTKKPGLLGKLGKFGAYGLGGIGAVLLGNHIKDSWTEMFSDRKSSQEVKTTGVMNVKNVLTEKLREKNASEKDIAKLNNLIDLENYYRDERNTLPSKNKEIQKVIKERKGLLGKYLGNKNSKIINNNQVSSLNSVDSTFNTNVDSSKSTIRAEVKKIEKMKSENSSTKEIVDDFKKFLQNDWLDSFVQKFAALIVASKGAGKSFMPSAQPF